MTASPEKMAEARRLYEAGATLRPCDAAAIRAKAERERRLAA